MARYYASSVLVTLCIAAGALVMLASALSRPLLFDADTVTAATWRPAALDHKLPYLAFAFAASIVSASLALLLCLLLTLVEPACVMLVTAYVWAVRLVLPLAAVVLLSTSVWAAIDRVQMVKAKGPLPELQSSFIIFTSSGLLLLIATTLCLWYWWPRAFKGQPSHIVNFIASSHRQLQEKRDRARKVAELQNVAADKRNGRDDAAMADEEAEITPCIDRTSSDDCRPPLKAMRTQSLPFTEQWPPSYHTYPTHQSSFGSRQHSLPPYFAQQHAWPVQLQPEPVPPVPPIPQQLRRDNEIVDGTIADPPLTPRHRTDEPEYKLSDAPVSRPDEGSL